MEKPCYAHCEKCEKEFKYEIDGWLKGTKIPIIICSSSELTLGYQEIYDKDTTHCECNGSSVGCDNPLMENAGIFLFFSTTNGDGRNIIIVLYPYFNIVYCSTSAPSCITEKRIDTLFVAFDDQSESWLNGDVYGTELRDCDYSICDEAQSICRKAVRDMKEIDIKSVYIDFDEHTVSYK